MSRHSISAISNCRSLIAAIMLALLPLSIPMPLQAAAPARGLSTLPARNLSAGYLNAIRRGTGTTAQKVAALNYESVDMVLLAFTLLNSDGSLDFTYGNADLYRPHLIP